MNAFNTDKITKTFETKEQADAAAAQLIGKFRMFDCKVRKALPEYKGDRNKKFTLYVKASTVCEELEIRRFLKTL